MARIIVLEPQQYLSGVVSLVRGDQWQIQFRVMDRIGNVNVPVDMTSASGVTAYFPPTGGGLPNVAVPCTTIDAAQGLFTAIVTESVTPNVGLVPSPTSWYVRATTPQGLETYQTNDMPLVINDPSFNS